jgi:glycopeptide antibiotics resistance protein
MNIIIKFACVCYWIFLTVLLLTRNPARIVGLHAVPLFPWGKFGIHLSAFLVLSLLVHASRWPRRPWWPLIALLALYAVTTETLQILVPPRTARVMDAFENLLGIALGAGIYWVARRVRESHATSRLRLAEGQCEAGSEKTLANN